MIYVYLVVAITAEVVATTALKASDGFTRLAPSLVVVAGYAFAFYFLSLTLRVFPIGVVYAVWSGLGIVLISTVAYFYYGQTLNAPAILGLGLIIAGVVVVNLFSETMAH